MIFLSNRLLKVVEVNFRAKFIKHMSHLVDRKAKKLSNSAENNTTIAFVSSDIICTLRHLAIDIAISRLELSNYAYRKVH